MVLYRGGLGVITRDYIQGIIVDSNVKEHTIDIKVIGSVLGKIDNDEKGKVITINRNDVRNLAGKERSAISYFQPRLTDEQWESGQLNSFDVYRHHENVKEDFPDAVIDIYRNGDIENPTFIDDEDGRSPEYEVSVPKHNEDTQIFFTSNDKEEAKLFAQIFLFSDSEGRIETISKIS